MFRVPLDTVVLRRASAATLLVFATALSACGDDKSSAGGGSDGQSAINAPGGDVSQAPAGSTPTTPESSEKETPAKKSNDTALPGEETNEMVPGNIKAKKFSKENAAKITDKIENAATIAKQSAKTYTEAETKAQVAEVTKILEADGRKVETAAAGESGSLAILKTGGIRIMFFTSDRKATESTRNYQQLISTRPGYGRADHFGSRMWILTNPKKYTKADLADYREIRAKVEREV